MRVSSGRASGCANALMHATAVAASGAPVSAPPTRSASVHLHPYQPASSPPTVQGYKEGEQGKEPGEGGEGRAAGGEAGGEGATAAAAPGGKEEAGILEQGRVTFLYRRDVFRRSGWTATLLAGCQTTAASCEGPLPPSRRPKVGKDEVGSLDDVQRFFMLLQPSKAGVKSRLMILGKKRLPSARRHEVGRRVVGEQPSGRARTWVQCREGSPGNGARARARACCDAKVLAVEGCRSPHDVAASRQSCRCSLPDAQRFFGFVESTADSPEKLLQGLGPQEYETKTRGEQAAKGWVGGWARTLASKRQGGTTSREEC